MSAVIELDSSDEDNEVVEVMETRSEVKSVAGPNMCLNPMGLLAKSQGFIKEFVDLINLCFKYESSQGMERILTKNLIPNYNELNTEYAKSDKLKVFLRNVIKKLMKQPNMKFCCLKEVSKHFKENKMKKKVGFVTLNNKASDKFKRYYQMQNEKKNKKKPDSIIILGENEDLHPQIINLDDEQNDIIDLETCDIPKNVAIKLNSQNCTITKLTESDNISQCNTKSLRPKDSTKNISQTMHKENKTSNMVDSDYEQDIDQYNDEHIESEYKKNMDSNNIVDSDCEENLEQSLIETSHSVHSKNMASNNIVDSDSDDIMDQSDPETIEIDHASNVIESIAENLNISQETVEIRNDTISSPINNNYKTTLSDDLLNVYHKRKVMEHTNKEIKALETQIRLLKLYLIKMEESEVDSDSLQSPYMEAHKTKLVIIEKYKKICQLRGESYKPRKCRQFQLQVKEGHPAGPARKLEEWLNTNTDKNGESAFPCLRDVIMCVWVANQEDGLGWDINRTYQEARILFTQCGQHLQKRRQQREWRDLLQTVKTSVEQDPADSDPQLLEKLESNRRLARAKFDGIIEHYVKLEDETRKKSKKETTIKITDVKSLSTPNPEPTWEVPITGLIREVPRPELISKMPISGVIIEEVPINGLIQINRNTLINNQDETNIKTENIDETFNNSHQIISNENPNNIHDVAFELLNSVKTHNNIKSIQTDIDRGQAANNTSPSSQNSSKNSPELSKTVNRKTVESYNSDVRKNVDNGDNESSSIVYGTHQISKSKVKSETENVEEDSDDLSEDDEQNNSQKSRENIDCKENMETEDVTSQTDKLHSEETMEIVKVTKNITNENEMNTVTENTHKESTDSNNKCNTIEKSDRTNNNDVTSAKELTSNYKDETKNYKELTNNGKDKTNNDKDKTNSDKDITTTDKNLLTEPSDKSKIKPEVKMEVDFSEEDFDKLFDQNFTGNMPLVRVFDVEDTVVIIELSSSESESDDDCQLITL